MQRPQTVRTLFSVGGLIFFMFLALGSFDSDVTVNTVKKAKKKAEKSLKSVSVECRETVEEIGSSYKKLGKYLEERNLSDANIITLENKLNNMRENYDSLKTALKNSENDGDDLFDMLKSRANDQRQLEFRVNDN